MAYAVKYILQFTSDRGNEIRIEVLKKDYQGEVIYKSLGGSPSLSIEQGDGAIKGSSLVFAMQADIEGELQELYTTDNKQFKVNMYRNEVLSWQGYILPELYSEEYVDAPYDVSVTATDQLATLKAITYQREDVNVSLSTIIEDILSFTQISVPVTYHQNLSALRKGEVPMLVDSHISQAAYNGYSCYDVLNNILLSCNCCIMQINGEWLITSLTNSTTNYYTAGVSQVREHKALGQLGVGEVCPAGTLTMVNNPALKGAKVEYAHMLRHSFLANADCVDREGWNYTPDSRNPIDIPGEREAFGKIFKTYCWELHPVNIREDNSLQLWQEVALEKDERNYYDLSVKTLFSTDAKLLLMAVTYLGSDGVERRLTSEGWIEKWDKSDVNYYIQITGTNKNAGLDAIADIEQYEMSTVQFALPPVDGTMRIGFINSTTDYKDPLGAAPIYVSQVYLTVSGVTGQECTTEVEPNATQEQQGVLLAYGDTFESENAYKLGLNTLKKSSGENITSWWLDNENFSSYYDTMLQEFSRYFGVKKAQLQGIIMGKDVLSDMYADVFSGRVMRLLSAQVDLLADEASVTVEEVITTIVDFDTVIYATNNTNSFGSSSGGGAGTSGGASSTAGESLLGVQSDGDVYVKDGRALVGQEGRFENLALPVDAPLKRAERKTYVYASNPDRDVIDLEKIAKYIEDQEALWVLDKENGVIRTRYNVVSEQEIISGRRASGSGSGGGGTTQITAQMITDALGYIPYSSFNPAGYVTSAAIPTALKNPYALTINGHTYDGSEAVNITISAGGGVADSVDWANVYNKPTTLGGYGITDALSTSGGTITGGFVPLYLKSNASAISMRFGVGDTTKAELTWDNTEGVYIYNYPSGCFIGVKNDGTPNYNGNTLIHSGNYSSYALPLSGGTIEGTGDTEYIQLRLNGPSMCNVGFMVNGVEKGVVGYWSNIGARLQNPNGYGLAITDENTPVFYQDNLSNAKSLIHSGNIGSYKAGDSDKLAGQAASYYTPLFKEKVTLLNSSNNLNDYRFGYIGSSGTDRPANDLGYNTGILAFASARGYDGCQIGYAANASNNLGYTYLAVRSEYNGTKNWTQWYELLHSGNIGSYNAGSATKLQTARTIWGQSFDGTSDVDGNIAINSDAVLERKSSAVWLNYGPANKNENLYLFGYNTQFYYGTASGYRLAMDIKPTGNILIGTTSDSGQKLQVNGGVKLQGYVDICEQNTSNILTATIHGNIGRVYAYDGVNGAYRDLYLGQSSTNALTVKANGNVLIGTATDSGHKLRVDGGNVCISEVADVRVFLSTMNTSPGVNTYNSFRMGRFDENTGGFKMQFGGTDCNLEIIDYNWKVALFTLSSSGNLIARGEVISSRRATSSDARLKDNINRLIAEDCLAMVRNLQPSSWQWKEDGEFSLGFIAQDVEPLMPYAVTRIKDDVLGQRLNLQYDQFFAPVVGAIQCLDIKVEGHETRLKRLETENVELKNRLSKYEAVWQ